MEDELFDVFNEQAAKPKGGKREKKNRKRSVNGDVKSPDQAQNGEVEMAQADAPANGAEELADDGVQVGTYNGIIAPNEYYSPENSDFASSHKTFKRMVWRATMGTPTSS